jgi:exodeoxyribonuclease III
MKVVSYNLCDGGGDRLTALSHILQAQEPDVVAVTEANSLANARTLAETLEMSLVYGEANSAAAVAWLSRLPIVASRNHRIATLAKTLLQVEIVWKGVVVPLFVTHLIHGRTESHAHRREQEIHAILNVLQPYLDQPHLLTGDFNAIHPNDQVGNPPLGEIPGIIARQPIQLLLESGYVDTYRSCNPSTVGYTYPALHPWLRLDYIFASSSLAIHLDASGIIQGTTVAQASDHLPIWAEFHWY